MGTISFMALYALYFDIFWWYLSHISLLWRWRKPEDVEKKILGLGFYTVLWNRGSWVQFCLWHYLLCILIFSGIIWVIYHYYGDGGSQKMLRKKTRLVGELTRFYLCPSLGQKFSVSKMSYPWFSWCSFWEKYLIYLFWLFQTFVTSQDQNWNPVSSNQVWDFICWILEREYSYC